MGSIRVAGLGKAYKQYMGRWSRLAEWVVPFGGARHNLHWVLQDISFQVDPGESVGIIGINGAGKSTLLKLITGTIQPTSGSVQVSGRVAALLELGMGFHQDFTGRQNAVMAGQLLGLSIDEIAALMPHIEEFAEIGTYLDQPVRIYSSGMQVRLAFSVATARRPDILIVDEALAVGDIFFQQKCFDRIREFQRAGTTLLFVSHSLSTVYALCNRALLLEGGKIAIDGAPKKAIDLYNAIALRHQQAEHSPLSIVRATPDSRQVQAVQEPARAGEIPRDPDETGVQAQPPQAEAADVGSYSSTGVTIEAVRLLVNGAERDTVTSGCSGAVRIRICCHEDIEDPHIGFQIRDSRGEAVFMTTTAGMGQNLGPVQGGDVVEAEFSFRIGLAEGQYTITAGVANEALLEGGFRQSLVRIQAARAFTVVNDLDSYRWAGIYNVFPECRHWRVEA